MHDIRHNLLVEPTFSIVLADGTQTRLSLSELLASLSAGKELEYAALRPHQGHSWHAFLVQLAALVLHVTGASLAELDEASWCAALRELGGGDAPWCLLVENRLQPAFFQMPVPDGRWPDYKRRMTRPDMIDVLVTSRGHDLKDGAMVYARPEHWAYALVSAQTSWGFGGVGNYGIARMNSGSGSRPCVSVDASRSWASRFGNDVELWRAQRRSLVEERGYRAQDGHALLWLEPWNGVTSIALPDCDPFFIEACRRYRLVAGDDSSLVACFATSEGTRIAAKEAKGNTGDIWAPVKTADGACVSISGKGFSFDVIQDLLLGESYRPSPAQERVTLGNGERFLYAEALARGQGKTEGWHQRVLSLPPKIVGLLARPAERDRLATTAKERVGRVAEVRNRVLRPALCCLLQGDPPKLNLKDNGTERWTSRLNDEIDRIFFQHLWQDAELSHADAHGRWIQVLMEVAQGIFEAAIREAPMAEARRYRTIAGAERVFWGSARKALGYESRPIAAETTEVH